MAIRASATSTLQFATISVPVSLKKIGESKDVTFDRVSVGGNAIEQKEIDASTGEVQQRGIGGTIRRGTKGPDGSFYAISDEDIEKITDMEKLDVFEITDFIPMKDVPFERAMQTYFLTPQAKTGARGVAPMALLHKALTKTRKAGVLKIGLTTRQYLAVVYPKGKALYVTTLAWAEDWARADEAQIFEGISVDPKVAAVAVNLIEAMTAENSQAALDSKTDTLRAAKKALIDKALTEKPLVPGKSPKPATAPDDLLATIEESLVQQKAKVKA